MSRAVTYLVLGASVALGLWILAAPEVIGLTGGARLSHLIVGPVAASFAVIAMSAATRLVVRANVALGTWLVVAPLVLDHGGWALESALAGGALVALALIPRGEGYRYGGGWAALFDGHGH